MTLPTRPRRPLTAACGAALCALALLAGCAGDPALRESERLIAAGKPREGLDQLQQAMRAHPDDLQYRAAYVRQRDVYLAGLLAQADAAARAGRFEDGRALYREVLGLHPENSRAQAGLAALDATRRNQAQLAEAEAALNRDELEAARSRLRAILAQEAPQTPLHAQAQALLARVEEKAGRPRGLELPQLAPNYRRNITLEFRDAPLKSVFDALARQSGLNFMFDKDVRTDQKTTVFARNTPIVDALDMLLATSQLARKALNANTLLVYPNLPAKQRDYQDMVVRAFFLANADPKQVLVMIKTMARIKDVHVDEKLNMVVVRDTPEAVRIAEKLVRLADRPEPEVMLEVEILEVKRSKLQELGVQWPTSLSVLTPEASSSSDVKDGVIVTTNTPAGRLTVDQLRKMNWGDLGVSPNPSINFGKTDGDVSLLANPRIRVKNREKAKVHVGDKVPVITSNVTATGVTSESVSYLDVGLKLDVEPQVYLESEVGMKVGLEVSNIVQQVKTTTGTLTYQLGSRNATTTLRLKDGETQVLAGLIADEDRSSVSKVPGLGDLPLLGRLFSNNRDEKNKSEIVLLITPRILRNVERPELADAEFFAGTETVVSGQPMRLRPAADLPRRLPGPEAPAGAEPEAALPQEPPAPPEAAPAAPAAPAARPPHAEP